MVGRLCVTNSHKHHKHPTRGASPNSVCVVYNEGLNRFCGPKTRVSTITTLKPVLRLSSISLYPPPSTGLLVVPPLLRLLLDWLSFHVVIHNRRAWSVVFGVLPQHHRIIWQYNLYKHQALWSVKENQAQNRPNNDGPADSRKLNRCGLTSTWLHLLLGAIMPESPSSARSEIRNCE